jgi:hypothetical protein
MRLLTAILVIVQLLLRGVAVPHVHAAESDVPGHTIRPHVHLAGHAGHHADTHHHHHDGRRHGHAHDTMHTEDAENGLAGAAPAPDHDDDAVYVSDDTVMLMPSGRSSPTDTAVQWLAVPILGVSVSPPAVEMRPRRVRPPGEGAATIHTLLPHVLRV